MTEVSRLAMLGALAIAGCGGGSDDEAEPAGGNTVAMENIQFSPKELTVEVGATVTWVNQEAVEHNVVAESVPGLKSPLLGEGGKFAFKTTEAGTIAYVCTVHPGMEGTLAVE